MSVSQAWRLASQRLQFNSRYLDVFWRGTTRLQHFLSIAPLDIGTISSHVCCNNEHLWFCQVFFPAVVTAAVFVSTWKWHFWQDLRTSPAMFVMTRTVISNQNVFFAPKSHQIMSTVSTYPWYAETYKASRLGNIAIITLWPLIFYLKLCLSTVYTVQILLKNLFQKCLNLKPPSPCWYLSLEVTLWPDNQTELPFCFTSLFSLTQCSY